MMIAVRPSRPARSPALQNLFADRQGVAALEFAIVGPLLFMLIFAVVNLGDLAWTYTALHNGVETAARFASVQSDAALAAATSSGSVSPQTCASTPSIQSVFAQSVAGPILNGSIPTVYAGWGGTLAACNAASSLTPAQGLPGGFVMVTARFGWQPLAMPDIFGPITINVSALKSVMEAPAS